MIGAAYFALQLLDLLESPKSFGALVHRRVRVTHFYFWGRPSLVRTRKKRGQTVQAFSVAMEMQEWIHFALFSTY